MEQKEYSAEGALEFILDAFRRQGDFLIVGEEALARMVAAVIEEDAAYMHFSGADAGEVYDDDAAYDYMFERMQARFPEQKMYAMRFVEDYLEYNEQYLESIGAIEWE